MTNKQINTNEYVVENLNEEFDNYHLEEVRKIVSINKNNNRLSRDFIIKNTHYTADEKIIYLDILDNLNSVNRKAKIQTSNYDGKVYALMFINDFLAFLRKPEHKFSFSEFKLLLVIYEMISKANSISNCLIGVKKTYLAEQAGIDIKNLSKVFKGLQNKGVVKIDENGSIFINYEFFYMGNSLNYDLYKTEYSNLENSMS